MVRIPDVIKIYTFITGSCCLYIYVISTATPPSTPPQLYTCSGGNILMYIMYRLEETFNYALQSNVEISGVNQEQVNTTQAINDGDLVTYNQISPNMNLSWKVNTSIRVAVKSVSILFSPFSYIYHVDEMLMNYTILIYLYYFSKCS